MEVKMVITKEDHLRIVKIWKRRVWKLVACFLLLVIGNVGMYGITGLERNLIKESYGLFKFQYNILWSKQQLYILLRNKSLTVGQALDIADAILGQNKVPISIALAMIAVESDFDPTAISHKGARGLTQIMPIVRKEYAGHPSFGKEIKQVHEPSVNVKLGLLYLGDLKTRFKDWKPALRAYNAGPENANNRLYDVYANLILKKSTEFETILKNL